MKRIPDGAPGAHAPAPDMDEMIGLVLHDIRNPLSAARGYLSLMRLGPSASTPQDVAAAEECIDSALALMDEVVELGRIERGELLVSCRPVDVSGVAEAAAARLGPVADRMGRTLTVAGCASAATACADEGLIGRVVAELVAGGLKYASSAVTVAVAERPSEGLAEIRVSDDGMPVATEMLEALFDAAAQVSLREAASRRGMGLSLPFARAACRAMGGSVHAESSGRGLSVVVTLPAASAGKRQRVGLQSTDGRDAQLRSKKSVPASCA